MANENGNGAGGGRANGSSEEITQVDDYARLFCTNLGLSISEIGRRIATLGGKLPTFGPARRRAVLFGILEEIDDVNGTLDDARGVIRDHAQNSWIDPAKEQAP